MAFVEEGYERAVEEAPGGVGGAIEELEEDGGISGVRFDGRM